MNLPTTKRLHKRSTLPVLLLLMLVSTLLPQKITAANSTYSVNGYGELTKYTGSPM